MKKKKKPKENETPGSLLAKMLSGDASVSNQDFEEATKKFFNDMGVDVRIKME